MGTRNQIGLVTQTRDVTPVGGSGGNGVVSRPGPFKCENARGLNYVRDGIS